MTITRHGVPAAVLISPDDLEALEETVEISSDCAGAEELRDAERAVAEGDVVQGIDAVRRLRAH